MEIERIVVNVPNLKSFLRICIPGAIRVVYFMSDTKPVGVFSKLHFAQLTAIDPNGYIVRLQDGIVLEYGADNELHGDDRVAHENFVTLIAITREWLRSVYSKIHDGEIGIHKDIQPINGEFECAILLDGKVVMNKLFWNWSAEEYPITLF